MVKNVTLVIVGLLLIVEARWLRQASSEVIGNAQFRPIKRGEALPGGRADLYFGPPNHVKEMPQVQDQIRIAEEIQNLAGGNEKVGGSLILIGVVLCILGSLRAFTRITIRELSHSIMRSPEQCSDIFTHTQQEPPCDTPASS